MTSIDSVLFAQAFNRLAVATRLPADQTDESMQRIYWDGLIDMPIEAVVAAADQLAKQSQWFPKMAEWRDVAYQHRLRSVLSLPDGREEPWYHECSVCEDTGWERRTCYPGTLNTCGRKRCHYEHVYVERCTCRPNNRTYQRHHAVLAGGHPS